jgi:hypothetical protein
MKRAVEPMAVAPEGPLSPPERLEDVLQTRWPAASHAMLHLMHLQVTKVV